MTQLKAGHIVRLPDGGLCSSGLALVTKVTAKAVTVTTGCLKLMYEPEQLTNVGHVEIGGRYSSKIKMAPAFRRTFVFIGEKEHRFDVVVREPRETGEITARGDIRKLAFARWLEALP